MTDFDALLRQRGGFEGPGPMSVRALGELVQAHLRRAEVVVGEPTNDRSGCDPLVRSVPKHALDNSGAGPGLSGKTRGCKPLAARWRSCGRRRATHP
jgi:hypothetical protein